MLVDWMEAIVSLNPSSMVTYRPQAKAAIKVDKAAFLDLFQASPQLQICIYTQVSTASQKSNEKMLGMNLKGMNVLSLLPRNFTTNPITKNHEWELWKGNAKISRFTLLLFYITKFTTTQRNKFFEKNTHYLE